MRMESGYLVSAKTEQAIDCIISKWEDVDEKVDETSFEGFATSVWDVMENVIKVVHAMELEGQKEDFSIVGKCETDYDCIVYSIEYNGTEPMIKASLAEPDFNEERYESFLAADYEDIPKILKRNKNRTFKQAVKDDLPLGGFLEEPYEKWYKSIIGE